MFFFCKVGCLAAKYLVKCGFDVTIYENRNG